MCSSHKITAIVTEMQQMRVAPGIWSGFGVMTCEYPRQIIVFYLKSAFFDISAANPGAWFTPLQFWTVYKPPNIIT